MMKQANSGIFLSSLPLFTGFVENEGNEKAKNKFFNEGNRDKG